VNLTYAARAFLGAPEDSLGIRRVSGESCRSILQKDEEGPEAPRTGTATRGCLEDVPVGAKEPKSHRGWRDAGQASGDLAIFILVESGTEA
jgi:hypothetical protein